ncbi:Smg-4/UPF3 family-domain-containing protein [Aspergillus californicus]
MTQILSKSAGGVLQIPVSATQKNAPASRRAPKPPAPRLKLLVRRLPPGLTQEEFETAVGAEWKVGAGKISWIQYKPGKVSKDPAKPSRPSRAYLYIISSDNIGPLSEKVRGTSFLDARNTANDPILLGPPTLEFAPYAKIPGSRVRKDARQGTIDIDPEFIQFLESLTQPIARSGPLETTNEGEDKEAVKTTPLVQYIKDKKANRARDALNKPSRNRAEKDAKTEKILSKKLLRRPEKEATQPAGAEKSDRRSRTDRATKEAVKAANKEAANVSFRQAPKAPAAQNSPKDATQPAPERKRERGNAAAAAKILQRDLGLAPSSNRRRGGRGTAGDNDSKNDQGAVSETKKSIPTGPSRGGSTQDNKAKQSNTPQPTQTPPPQRSETSTPTPAASTPAKPPKSGRGKQPAASAPVPTSTATQAFLKHANPSQGVTESLLDAAFSSFGKVVKVEIDKKKGFGYVDFADPQGLQKAIAASPVSVAQSQVVVLERKANPGAEKGRGKGRGEAKPPITGADTNNSTNTNANTSTTSNNANNNRGGKVNEGGTGGNQSRGRRSGRGNRSGKGGGGNANAPEKTAEAK